MVLPYVILAFPSALYFIVILMSKKDVKPSDDGDVFGLLLLQDQQEFCTITFQSRVSLQLCYSKVSYDPNVTLHFEYIHTVSSLLNYLLLQKMLVLRLSKFELHHQSNIRSYSLLQCFMERKKMTSSKIEIRGIVQEKNVRRSECVSFVNICSL